jgi:hypothetical protein
MEAARAPEGRTLVRSRKVLSGFSLHRGEIAGALVAGLVLGLAAPRTPAQQATEAPTQEIVANLAAGRVVIAVVKDAILIGTVENPIEAETRPPTPVALSSVRAGVILGSVDWFSPTSQQDLARLGSELPHLRTRLLADAPHLAGTQGGGEATDIEATGQGLFERLNAVAKGLHGKVQIPADEPLAELIIADYLAGYGPEVWQVKYEMKQVQERRDYWDTRVLRPIYLQFWPPEKGAPRTLLEFDYPPEKHSPTLLEMLRQKDPRLEKIRSSDARMAQLADFFLAGDSSKVMAADATQFLRAALDATAPPRARETMALIRQESGFQWVLPPPQDTQRPAQQQAQQPAEPHERPPEAPSLLKPPTPR